MREGDARATRATSGREPGKRTLTEQLAPRPSGGDPLPADVRAPFETAFGTDFASVRVHRGAHVDALGARAYAQGEDLHFAPGAYDPTSASGRELIGHELGHVVQQRAGRVAAPARRQRAGPRRRRARARSR